MRQAPRGSILGPPRARFRAVFVDHGGNGFFLGSLRGDHELTGWKARRLTSWGTDVWETARFYAQNVKSRSSRCGYGEPGLLLATPWQATSCSVC